MPVTKKAITSPKVKSAPIKESSSPQSTAASAKILNKPVENPGSMLPDEAPGKTNKKPVRKRRRANDIDQYVGKRLRVMRHELRVTQMRLADVADVSYQQIQKYERGKCRLTVGALQRVADHYDKQLAWFTEGAPGRKQTKQTQEQGIYERFALNKRSRRLAELFLALSDKKQAVVLDMIQEVRGNENQN